MTEQVAAEHGWWRPRYVRDDADECFYVLQGSFESEIGDRDRLLHAETDSTIYIPRGLPRSLRNTYPGAARLLVVETPARPILALGA